MYLKALTQLNLLFVVCKIVSEAAERFSNVIIISKDFAKPTLNVVITRAIATSYNLAQFRHKILSLAWFQWDNILLLIILVPRGGGLGLL